MKGDLLFALGSKPEDVPHVGPVVRATASLVARAWGDNPGVTYGATCVAERDDDRPCQGWVAPVVVVDHESLAAHAP